jgi:TonB family protein
MRSAAEYFLSFLLNASWQVALVAVVASLADLLLRRTKARYSHWMWVATLLLSLALPVLTSMRPLMRSATRAPAAQPIEAVAPVLVANIPELNSTAVAPTLTQRLQIRASVAAGVFAIFLLFLGYRATRFGRAWARTRRATKQALPFDVTHRVHTIVSECRRAITARHVTLANSTMLSAPATVGVMRPLIILPDALAREATDEELTAAVGHELVHVRHRDYLLNLIYELIFLPLSFHPAAVLMRRRITQTRELRCDELVAELLLQPEVYARSLVQLAHSAMPLGRRNRTIAVGIADADILEVRIMSLMGKRKLNNRTTTFLLIGALFLLALPCAAAASLSFHVNVNEGLSQEPQQLALNVNERKPRLIYHTEAPYTDDARAKNIEGTVGLSLTVAADGVVSDVKVTKPLYPSLDQSAVDAARNWRFEPYINDGQPAPKQLSVEVYFSPQQDRRAREEQEIKETMQRRVSELETQIKSETNMEVKAKLEQELAEVRARMDRSITGVVTAQGNNYIFLKVDEPRVREELEVQDKQRAALVKMAKISMDQAIQIATSQSPGKVLECSLVGERWSAPGDLAQPSRVLYHVVIMSGDEANPATYHVLVNAVDGSVVKSEKEERKRENPEARTEEGAVQSEWVTEGRKVIRGGVLNGRAISLPNPPYPPIAKAAKASGAVNVEVLIDETGHVIAAHAVSGHPLLQSASVAAARQAVFTPTRLSGEPVKVSGVIVYNFVIP